MKRRILVRVVLVLILLLALYPLTKFVILPLFDTSGELEGHDVPLYGYSEPDTPMVMENDALRFELDPATTHFTLTDKRTGHVWLSSPDNADSDPINYPAARAPHQGRRESSPSECRTIRHSGADRPSRR